MPNRNLPDVNPIALSPNVASIVAGLGGEPFLAEIGARNLSYDGTHVGFTLTRPCPKQVRIVTIQAQGPIKMECFGSIKPVGHDPPPGRSSFDCPRVFDTQYQGPNRGRY